MSLAFLPPISQPLLAEGDGSARRPATVIVHIANLDLLMLAYGASLSAHVQESVAERLHGCGFPAHSLSDERAVFLIDLPAAYASAAALDCLLERLRAEIEGRPIVSAGCRIYLQAGLDVFYRADDRAPADVQEAFAQGGDAPGGDGLPAVAVGTLRSDLLQAGMLLDALEDGALALAFQPILRTDGAVLYHEALLRHADPGGQGAFNVPQAIMALERTGGAVRLDRCVVWTCVQLLHAHPQQRLGCNVSATSLRDAAWWRLLLAHLAAHPLIAGRLVLEITETSAVPASAAAFALLARLRACGASIAIDDMGAGHSTLEFLARSQADVVKMDRSLLAHALQSPGRPDMLRDLVAACAVLCPCVVVEGIETAAEFAAVQQSGARGLQGFLIQVPELQPSWLKPAKAIVAWDASTVAAEATATAAALASRASACGRGIGVQPLLS